MYIQRKVSVLYILVRSRMVDLGRFRDGGYKQEQTVERTLGACIKLEDITPTS